MTTYDYLDGPKHVKPEKQENRELSCYCNTGIPILFSNLKTHFPPMLQDGEMAYRKGVIEQFLLPHSGGENAARSLMNEHVKQKERRRQSPCAQRGVKSQRALILQDLLATLPHCVRRWPLALLFWDHPAPKVLQFYTNFRRFAQN